MLNISFSLVHKALFLVAVASCAAGCSDALLGRWEAKEDSTVDLEIEDANDGYTGTGHLYLSDGVNNYLCSFDFDMTDAGDKRYEMNGHFTNDCASAGPFDGVDCELKDDDQLKCELPGGYNLEYEKN